MPDDAADLLLALADCRLSFPGANGSGLSGGSLAAWQTAYDSAKARAMASTRITSSQFDGGSSAGALQFDPRQLMRALLLRRAELDPDFDDLAFGPAAVTPRSSSPGYVIEFGLGAVAV